MRQLFTIEQLYFQSDHVMENSVAKGKKYLAWDLVYLHKSWNLLLRVIEKKDAVQI